MGPAVFSAPPVSLIVSPRVVLLCAMTCLFRLQDIDFPLDFLNSLLHRLHGGVLGRHFVGLRCQLGCQVYVCVSEVSHYRPVLCLRPSEFCKGLLDAHQVVGYVAALA